MISEKDADLLAELRDQDHISSLYTRAADRLEELLSAPVYGVWNPIETAPKNKKIDIWVTGQGSRRITNCIWGKPFASNWGDRCGDDKNLPDQWITEAGFSLDRRNGKATHWTYPPLPPIKDSESMLLSEGNGVVAAAPPAPVVALVEQDKIDAEAGRIEDVIMEENRILEGISTMNSTVYLAKTNLERKT